MTLDTITVTGITAHAFHGVEPEEKRDGQEFTVDLTAWLDTHDAAQHDDLNATANYAAMAADTYQILTGPSLDLIETLAEHIAFVLLEKHERLEKIAVTVHKPHAPFTVPVRSVAVTITRTRADYLHVAPGNDE